MIAFHLNTPARFSSCFFFLFLLVWALSLPQAGGQSYKIYDGYTIYFHFIGPEFAQKRAEFFQLKLLITDQLQSKQIENYYLYKESKKARQVLISLNPENYHFPNFLFPQQIIVEDILYQNRSIGLIETPKSVVEILPFPIVLNESRYDPQTNELIILGKNLIDAKAVHLRFDPFMLYGIDYVDVSSYPLESDEVTLHIFNLPRKVNLDPSPLYLTHIDTGAGLERLPQRVCLVTCEIQDRGSSFQAISDSVRKNGVCVLFERAKKAIVRLRDLIENASRMVIQKARDCIHYAWNYSLFALLKGLFSNVSVICGDLL